MDFIKEDQDINMTVMKNFKKKNFIEWFQDFH